MSEKKRSRTGTRRTTMAVLEILKTSISLGRPISITQIVKRLNCEYGIATSRDSVKMILDDLMEYYPGPDRIRCNSFLNRPDEQHPDDRLGCPAGEVVLLCGRRGGGAYRHKDPMAYWRKLKQRLKEGGNQTVTNTSISRAEQRRGLEKNRKVVQRGGRMAGNARKELEQETGGPVVTHENA